jgi:hypothetical protein
MLVGFFWGYRNVHCSLLDRKIQLHPGTVINSQLRIGHEHVLSCLRIALNDIARSLEVRFEAEAAKSRFCMPIAIAAPMEMRKSLPKESDWH